MARTPKVGDIVLVGYLDPNHEPQFESHPAIVVRVNAPGNPESDLELTIFRANICSPTAAGGHKVPYSPMPAIGHWSWRPDDPPSAT